MIWQFSCALVTASRHRSQHQCHQCQRHRQQDGLLARGDRHDERGRIRRGSAHSRRPRIRAAVVVAGWKVDPIRGLSKLVSPRYSEGSSMWPTPTGRELTR